MATPPVESRARKLQIPSRSSVASTPPRAISVLTSLRERSRKRAHWSWEAAYRGACPEREVEPITNVIPSVARDDTRGYASAMNGYR